MREFSIVRELSRREVERHKGRFIGVTVTEPRFEIQDHNGLTEWICDIRVGVIEGWATIQNCLIAQWALGAITDINIPVIAERSEGGRVTIIARSEIQLPDITLDTYTYEELAFGFMRNLITNADGSVVDGFGYQFAPPGSVTPASDDLSDEDDEPGGAAFLQTVNGPKNMTPIFINDLIEWGSTDFEYGITLFGARQQFWQGLRDVRREIELPELA